MRRRAFLGLMGLAAAWPLLARAQQTKIPRVGFVWIGSPEHESLSAGGLRQGLLERGYVFGADLAFDERYAEGKPERDTDADRRASGGPASTSSSRRGLRRRSRRTRRRRPCPSSRRDALTQTGLTAGLARPGGNVTGVDVQSNDYRGKWLELLEPWRRTFVSSPSCGTRTKIRAVLRLKEAEPRFGLTLTFLSARPQDLETSLSAIAVGQLQRPDCQRQRLPPAAGASHRRAGRREPDADPLRVDRRRAAGRPDGLFRQFFRGW